MKQYVIIYEVMNPADFSSSSKEHVPMITELELVRTEEGDLLRAQSEAQETEQSLVAVPVERQIAKKALEFTDPYREQNARRERIVELRGEDLGAEQTGIKPIAPRKALRTRSIVTTSSRPKKTKVVELPNRDRRNGPTQIDTDREVIEIREGMTPEQRAKRIAQIEEAKSRISHPSNVKR